MKVEASLFRSIRENILASIKELSLDEINKIPEGFTGNIAWHLGHMVATHRGLVYQLNGVAGGFEKEFVLKFKKGSVPESPLSDEEYEFITEHLLNQIDELENDLEKDAFWGENIEYTTSFNYTMTSLEESVKFSNIHQALHLGYIMALKRVVLL
jgi:uncharacterized damage-inducible protein DinB